MLSIRNLLHKSKSFKSKSFKSKSFKSKSLKSKSFKSKSLKFKSFKSKSLKSKSFKSKSFKSKSFKSKSFKSKSFKSNKLTKQITIEKILLYLKYYFVIDYYKFIENDKNNNDFKILYTYINISNKDNKFKSYLYYNNYINDLDNSIIYNNVENIDNKNIKVISYNSKLLNNIITINKYISIILSIKYRYLKDILMIIKLKLYNNNEIKLMDVGIERVKDKIKSSMIKIIKLYELDYNKKYEMEDVNNKSKKDFLNNYIISVSQNINFFQYNILEKILNKYDITNIDLYSSIGKRILFGYLDKDIEGDADQVKKHYNTSFYISNALYNFNKIDEKDNLYFYFKKYYPNEYLDYFQKSYYLTYNTLLKENKILIARPINNLKLIKNKIYYQASSGKDIIYITNKQTLDKAKLLLKKYNNVLLSEYIMNPILFKHRKFHLRCFFMVTIINNKIKTYLCETMLITLAKLHFKLDDFDNMDIHDTHLKSTDKDYFFPNDFTSENTNLNITPKIINKITFDIRKLFKNVSYILCKTGISKYKNHKHAFNIFGGDIMITDTFNIKLLEINNKAGFQRKDMNNTYFDNIIFNMIDNIILKPLLAPSSKIPNHINYIPIYTQK